MFPHFTQPHAHHLFSLAKHYPRVMLKTPTQRTYRPTIAPPSNGGLTPRPIHRVMDNTPPRHQYHNPNHNNYLMVQRSGLLPSVPPPIVGYNSDSGLSTIRPYRPQIVPPVKNGHVQAIGPTTQQATPDSGSESDVSVEELWSPASGSSSAVSTAVSESILILGYDDDTDSEDEEEHILNSVMHQQVRDGLDIHHRHGLHVLIEVLINFGTNAYPSARPTATVARSIIKRLHLRNEQQARDLQNYLRYEVVRLFRNYWMSAGEWRVDKARNLKSPYLTLKGVNLAGLLGSLFRVDILSGDDVHLCLNHVATNVIDFHPLSAIHALITHCGKKICRRTLLPGTNRFWALISTVSPQTGQYIWAYDNISFELLMDVFGTLDRWLATQTLKQIRAASDPVKIAKRKKNPGLQPKTNP